MRKSYIAKGSEALNLHNGKQTAIVVKMNLPKWCKRIELQGGRQKDPTCYSLVDLNENNAYDTNGEYLTLIDISPYQIWQEVYVRESWLKLEKWHYIDRWYVYKAEMDKGSEGIRQEYLKAGYPYKFKSAATMPKQAARTRFKIVGCEVVRVREMTVGNGLDLGCGVGNWGAARELFISKFGQSAWDNNDYIWFYKIEKI